MRYNGEHCEGAREDDFIPLSARQVNSKGLMTRSFSARFRRAAVVLGVLLILTPAQLQAKPAALAPAAAIEVVQGYLQAVHARDFATVYGYVSSVDRVVRDKNTYLRSQAGLNGFALDLAKRLAAGTEVWVINQKSTPSGLQLEMGYRAPTADEISSQLLDWNRERLNALSTARQSALLAAVSKLTQGGKMITVEGRDTFDLRLEKEGWTIFLDWRSQHRVLLKTSRPQALDLAMAFSRSDIFVKRDEPFQVDFTIANRTHHDLFVRLNHSFEPRRAEKHIDMIACGALAPVRLRPHETQEVSSVYLLRGALPLEAPIAIIYDTDSVKSSDDKLLPTAVKRK